MLSSAPLPLAEHLRRPGCLVVPGCYDALSSKLIEAAGFGAAFLRAYAVQASLLGRPNIGYGTLTEHVECARRITDVITIPLIVDVATGFGDAIAIRRTVHDLERAGVAAIQVEDQARPWSPHSGGARPPLLPIDEMCAKISAAVDVRTKPGFLIIVWTFGTFGSAEEARDRAGAYVAAGADVIMPALSPFRSALPPGSVPTDRREIVARLRDIGTALTVPLATHCPLAIEFPLADAEAAGVKLYVATQVTLAPAAAAVRASLAALAEGRIAEHFKERPPHPIVELGKLLRIDDFVAAAERFGVSSHG